MLTLLFPPDSIENKKRMFSVHERWLLWRSRTRAATDDGELVASLFSASLSQSTGLGKTKRKNGKRRTNKKNIKALGKKKNLGGPTAECWNLSRQSVRKIEGSGRGLKPRQLDRFRLRDGVLKQPLCEGCVTTSRFVRITSIIGRHQASAFLFCDESFACFSRFDCC